MIGLQQSEAHSRGGAAVEGWGSEGPQREGHVRQQGVVTRLQQSEAPERGGAAV